MDHFDPYNVLLAIATDIPVRLMTDFVLQGHTYSMNVEYMKVWGWKVGFYLYFFIYIFIQQWCIKLIKSESKGIYVIKYFCFK